MVRNSPIHGRGLFATGEIPPGEMVCATGGHISTRATVEKIAPILGPAEIQMGTISLSVPSILRKARAA